MARRRLRTLDIHELIRLKRTGETTTRIARLLGRTPKTARKYLKWAGEQGLLEADAVLPSRGELHRLLEETRPTKTPKQQVSSLARFETEIAALRKDGVEMTAICRRLEERHKVPISYSAMRRMVRRMEPKKPDATLRMEVAPGEEAQVDFGAGGLVLDADSQHRRSHVFVMVLSHSRHMYAEIVLDQRLETWLRCHIRAFAFFGGVPKLIVLDNLGSGIVKACREQPEAQWAYAECAEHHGCFIDPHPPAQPQIKGKVEQGGVHYVKRNFLAGRELETLDERNAKLRAWCLEIAGMRTHGTTKQLPREVFEQVEQSALLPLPVERYDLAQWSTPKLHRDCHVIVSGSYYSAPYRLVGQKLIARQGIDTVKIYTRNHELVATHERALEKGTRRTHPDHLPPHKLKGLLPTLEECREGAAANGPETARMAEVLLGQKPMDRRRAVRALLRLGDTHGGERLERACSLALAYDADDVATVRNILRGRLEGHGPDGGARPAAHYAFARRASELVTALLGRGAA